MTMVSFENTQKYVWWRHLRVIFIDIDSLRLAIWTTIVNLKINHKIWNSSSFFTPDVFSFYLDSKHLWWRLFDSLNIWSHSRLLWQLTLAKTKPLFFEQLITLEVIFANLLYLSDHIHHTHGRTDGFVDYVGQT
jgi:hypothetical protein